MTPALPAQVDLVKLAAQGATLRGMVATDKLQRLRRHFECVKPVEAELTFALDAQRRPVIRGKVHTEVSANCQRCLQPVVIAIDETFEVDGDDLAASDYTAHSGTAADFDVRALIEDEILLACPMIPSHAENQCAGLADEQPREKPGPFDVLRTLRHNDEH